ncbi:MAG: sulfatase [Planctomycetes bacterium]|nr:sulfatase [Planctomycetota bacterium]
MPAAGVRADDGAPWRVARLLPGPTSRGATWSIDSEWHRAALPTERPERGLAPIRASDFEGERPLAAAGWLTAPEFGALVNRALAPDAVEPAKQQGGRLELPQRESIAATVVPASPITPYVVTFTLHGAQVAEEPRLFVFDASEDLSSLDDPATLLARVRAPGAIEAVREAAVRAALPSDPLARQFALTPELIARGDDGATTWRVAFSSFWRTRALMFALCGSSGGRSSCDDFALHELPARALLALPPGAAASFDLPRPFESLDPQLRATKVRIDWESRRALLLPRGATATCRFAAPDGAAGGRLRFGLAIVREERLCTRGPRVEQVTVEFAGATRTLDLSLAFEAPSGWHEVELPLPSGAAPRELTIRVAGRDEPSGPLIAVSDPLLHAIDPAAPPRADAPWNVVVISLDTLRADRLGRRVNGRSLTPRLDALAARSLACSSALANASYTLPSHVSLFTAQRPSEHGVLTVNDRFSPDRSTTLTRIAAEHGYATAAFTSGGMLNAEFCGIDLGFDSFGEIDALLAEDDRLRLTAPLQQRVAYNREIARRARLESAPLPWLAAHRGTPFLLFLHSYLTHNYQPDPDLRAEFTRGLPPTPLRLHGPVPYRQLLNASYLAADGASDQRFEFEGEGPHEFVPERDLPWIEALYDATVAQADRDVGRLLDELARLRLADRTIVVVTSDHGEEFLEHGDLSHARSLFDEILRVPLLIHVPGAIARTLAEPVEHVDVAPTLLARLGLPIDPRMGGSDLLAPHFEARAITVHEGTEGSASGVTLRAARTRGGKLIVVAPLAPPELPASASALAQLRALGYVGVGHATGGYYDLRVDPGERHDLTLGDAMTPTHAAQMEALANHLFGGGSGGGR